MMKKTEIQIRNAKINLPLFTENTTIYIETNKESKNVTRIEFSKVSAYEVNIKINFIYIF